MTLHLATSLNSFIHSNNLIGDFLGFSEQMAILTANKEFCLFPSTYYTANLFSWLLL